MFKNLKVKLILWSVITFVIFACAYFWLTFYPDILWFTEVKYLNVYFTVFLARVGAFLLPALLAGCFLGLNIIIARKCGECNRREKRPAQKGSIAYFVEVLRESMFGGHVSEEKEINLTPVDDLWVKWLLRAVVIGLSIFFGLLAASHWDVFLKFFRAVPFQKTDPLFHKNIGFYMFSMPFFNFLQRWSTLLVVLSAVISGWIYFSDYVVQVVRGKLDIPVQAKRHLLVLVTLFFLLLAWLFRLKIFGLVYAGHNVFSGASYTDVHAVLPGLWCAVLICLLTAAVSLISLFFTLPWFLLLGSLGLLALSLVFFNIIYVPLVQKIVVAPNEITKEKPYIENNIHSTREAFGLETVEEHDFPYNPDPSAVLQQDVSFMKNLRVIDPKPLQQTLRQIQSIRTYYDFNDVDIDRYQFGREKRQVLIAARELFSEKIPERGRNWINEHLKYTHGYGVVMASVSESTPDGLPKLLVRDIPPVSATVPVTRPQIYFGERTDPYIIVNTGTEEFDYPEGDANKYTIYSGRGGISIGTFWRKLLYALHFQDLRILLSSYLTKDSKLFYRRRIQERVRHIMPLLQYDRDPYIVVSGKGELYWVVDAYVKMSNYPYATYFPAGFNYMRNSVKVVVNAYTGETKFYVFDKEPVIETIAKIFPGVFQDKASFPAELAEHIRYPEELFIVQADMYQTYHMTDAQVFYNQEDVWAIPRKSQGESQEGMQPYYVTLKFPSDPALQFLIMQPFTPNQKDNMIGWLSASCDKGSYGKLLLYRLPKQTLVYGPMQIEARIDQDPDISKELSLWGQKGSSVYRGNLLVVPVQNTFIYIEPIYLLATEGEIPELKRVIAASGEGLAMGATLAEALNGLLGGRRRPFTLGEQTPAALAQDALQAYRSAKAALKRGAWNDFGTQFDNLEQTLVNMSRTK